MNRPQLRKLALLLIILATATAVSAQQPKTVTEYLLALPDNFFAYVHIGYKYEKPQPKTRAEMDQFRRSRIALEDIKNGYLRYKESPETENWTEIALFKKGSGGYLMAINEGLQFKGCRSTLHFVEFANGKWSDVTKVFSPALNKSELAKQKKSIFCYVLPREGRKVRLYSKWYDEPEETWGYFEWNGEKFVDLGN